MLEPLKLDSLYHLTINSEYIPLDTSTISKIIKAMVVDFHLQKGLSEFDSISLFKSIEWKWMSVRGNLTKRISKWYYEQYKAKLLQETSTAIGNIVRNEIVKNQDYHYDFTRKFYWGSGEFGDYNSCFMSGDRPEIVQSMMKDDRFQAVRFFYEFPRESNPSNDQRVRRFKERYYKKNNVVYEGFSRAWLVQDKVTVKINGEDVTSSFYIIFNGYGMSTNTIASILASSFGCSYHSIRVSNNKNLHGGLYLNDGVTYIIGDEAVIKNIERYDFGLPYSQEDSARKSQIILKGSVESENLKKEKDMRAFRNGQIAAVLEENVLMRNIDLLEDIRRQLEI